jgi:hypothetical protein
MSAPCTYLRATADLADGALVFDRKFSSNARTLDATDANGDGFTSGLPVLLSGDFARMWPMRAMTLRGGADTARELSSCSEFDVPSITSRDRAACDCGMRDL